MEWARLRGGWGWDRGSHPHRSDRREQSPDRCLSGCGPGSHGLSMTGTHVPGRAPILGDWLHPLLMLPSSKPPALSPPAVWWLQGREGLQTQTVSEASSQGGAVL